MKVFLFLYRLLIVCEGSIIYNWPFILGFFELALCELPRLPFRHRCLLHSTLETNRQMLFTLVTKCLWNAKAHSLFSPLPPISCLSFLSFYFSVRQLWFNVFLITKAILKLRTIPLDFLNHSSSITVIVFVFSVFYIKASQRHVSGRQNLLHLLFYCACINYWPYSVICATTLLSSCYNIVVVHSQ